MSRINQTVMRDLLAQIFGVDPQYIVPKQGTWWNPTGGENTPAKPKTWCAYRLESHTPVTLTHKKRDSDTPRRNWSVQHKRSRLVLQFVGDQAEDLANSVGHWTQSAAVQRVLDIVNASIFADVGAVSVTEFDQEGGNTVLAYNVIVPLLWPDEIDTQQGPMPALVFQGEVNS